MGDFLIDIHSELLNSFNVRMKIMASSPCVVAMVTPVPPIDGIELIGKKLQKRKGRVYPFVKRGLD